jgi:hypothetical protein
VQTLVQPVYHPVPAAVQDFFVCLWKGSVANHSELCDNLFKYADYVLH